MSKFELCGSEPAHVLYDQGSNTSCSRSWNLTDPLFKFTRFSKSFTLDLAFRGIMIYGATGSGKSSSSGRLIASAYLKHGFGGLVLCAKAGNDEFNNFQSIAKLTARSDSLIEFGLKNNFCFNFIEFFRRFSSSANEAQTNLVKILSMVANGLERAQLKSQDPFWDRVLEQYLSHLLTLSFAQYNELTFADLRTCFDQLQMDPKQFLSSFKITNRNISAALNYFTNEFVQLNEKTRSVVVASVSSMLFKFTLGDLRKLFGERGNIEPSWIFGGAVVIVNVPTQEFQEIGRVANMIWKFAFQHACLSRAKDNKRPVFLWADEAQEFIAPHDAEFQATARASFCASVYLTQNMALMRLKLGSGAYSTDAIKALESNMLTHIYHQNFDQEIIASVQAKIGKKSKKFESTTSRGSLFSDADSTTVSEKEVQIYTVNDFTHLRSGGRKNHFKCDAIVYSPDVNLFFFRKKYAVCSFSQTHQLNRVVNTELRHSVNFHGAIKFLKTQGAING